MGGTTGKLTHFGIAREVTFGTAVGATAYLKYNSETLTTAIEELIEASLNNRSDEGASYEGLNTHAGDSVHEVHPAGIGYLLRSALGSPLTVDNTGSYTHTYTPIAGRNADSGTATAGTSTTLTDSGATWTIDDHIGDWLHITAGTNSGEYRIISDNTATVITVASAFTSPIDATSVYEITPGPEHCALPPYTIEVHRDLTGSTPAFQYAGGVINTLSLTLGVGAKILTATSSWLAKSVANIAATTPSLPTTDPFMWDDAILGVGLAVGDTATGGSSTTIVKTAAGWTANAYQNMIVLTTGGTGPNQCRKISSNTTDTLTCTPAFTVAPASGTTFKVFNAHNLTETITFNWTNGLIAVPLLNNTNTIAQIDRDAFRSGTISRTVIPQQITDFGTYYTGWTTREWCLYFHGAQITGNHYYDLVFYFPKVLFTAYPVNVGGGGRITVADGLKIKYDSTAGYFMKCILQNNTSSY
jgi:hypothetical protein